jgi:hypothetical protein
VAGEFADKQTFLGTHRVFHLAMAAEVPRGIESELDWVSIDQGNLGLNKHRCILSISKITNERFQAHRVIPPSLWQYCVTRDGKALSSKQ